MKILCKNCEFWHVGQDRSSTTIEGKEVDIGECRCRSKSSCGCAGWPNSYSNEWCGKAKKCITSFDEKVWVVRNEEKGIVAIYEKEEDANKDCIDNHYAEYFSVVLNHMNW